MTLNEFCDKFARDYRMIDAPEYTMSSLELSARRSAIERVSLETEFGQELQYDLLLWLDEVIKIRNNSWKTRYNEARSILRLATKGRLSQATMSFALGAGKAIFWNEEKLLAAAETNRFHYEIALAHCSAHMRVAAEKTEYPHSKSMLTFVAKVLSGEIERPKSRGPHQLHSFGRDNTITSMVELARRNGLNAYRNEATNARVSACDLVADLCSESKIGVSTYEAVKRIYRNRGKRRAEFELYLYPCITKE